jgi:hypothetical protein
MARKRGRRGQNGSLGHGIKEEKGGNAKCIT